RPAAARWGVSESGLPSPHDLADSIGGLMPPADIVLLNVEGALGDEEVPPTCAPGSTACYAIRMPPAAADALRTIAPHATAVGTVANSQARDAGPQGFATTRWLLAEAGILVSGADSVASPLVVAPGVTIGVLGFGTSP